VSNDWDHYLCTLGDDLASIYLDLGIATIAPLTGFNRSVRVKIALVRTAENGMSTDDEFDDLIALEDDLVAGLHGEDAVYVGRLTSRGSRVFYFYARDDGVVARRASAVIERHAAYQAQIGEQPDAPWSTYFDFLYPSLETFQRLQNRRLN
jgi:hypothetical protein